MAATEKHNGSDSVSAGQTEPLAALNVKIADHLGRARQSDYSHRRLDHVIDAMTLLMDEFAALKATISALQARLDALESETSEREVEKTA
jgi:hypothetical protein